MTVNRLIAVHVDPKPSIILVLAAAARGAMLAVPIPVI